MSIIHNKCVTLVPLCLGGMMMLAVVSCEFYPFFPRTGEPIRAENSPEEVIDKLLRSYESKSITYFESLLPADKSFRFYVSPTFYTEYQGPGSDSLRPVVLNTEHIDSGFTYVPPGDYHYWIQDDEINSHRKMFEQASSITFTSQPQINTGEFVYHRGLAGDTLGVEVLMRQGDFEVMYPDPDDPFYSLQQPVTIERQVFYLVKDPATGLWVISKWFDMGSAGGTG